MFPSPDEARKQRAGAPLVILFGLLLLAVGFLSVREPWRLKRDGVSAPAAVVKLVERTTTGRNSSSTQHAVVRFVASNGEAIQFEDGMGSRPPMYRVGEGVRVLYLESSPGTSAIVDRGPWNLLPGFVIAAGGLLLLSLGLSLRFQRSSAIERPVPTTWEGGALADTKRETGAAPTRWWLCAFGLTLLALVLAFAPPHHKTGHAALGILLCVMAGVVAVFGTTIHLLASVVFAGLRSAVAPRSGDTRGLDVGDSRAWAAGVEDSPRLRALLSRYAHFRRAVWTTTITLLVCGDALMEIGLLSAHR